MFNEMFSYTFMIRATIAILLISPLFGMVGTMIVQKRMAYFSDALGHSALTGIAAGVIMGISNTTISMVVFGICFALLLNYISRKGLSSADTLISVFASCATALGLAILSRGGSFSNYSAIAVRILVNDNRLVIAIERRQDDAFVPPRAVIRSDFFA